MTIRKLPASVEKYCRFFPMWLGIAEIFNAKLAECADRFQKAGISGLTRQMTGGLEPVEMRAPMRPCMSSRP